MYVVYVVVRRLQKAVQFIQFSHVVCATERCVIDTSQREREREGGVEISH